MKFFKKYPVAALSSFVRYYWYFEINEDELPFSQPSYPYGAFELICYLNNPNTMQWVGDDNIFTEPSIFYGGQLTRPFVMSFDKPCECIGASLYPWAGNHLYGIPSNEFTNTLVPLEDIENDNSFYGRLKLCADKNALFNCFESYLLSRLHGKQNDPLVCSIAQQVICNPTREGLARSMDNAGLSRRRIEQRFINATGLSMGTFMRKVRFQKAVHLLNEQPPDLNLTAIGLQAGYFDQAHFINDFKSFTALSPKAFIAQKTELKDFLNTLVLVN